MSCQVLVLCSFIQHLNIVLNIVQMQLWLIYFPLVFMWNNTFLPSKKCTPISSILS